MLKIAAAIVAAGVVCFAGFAFASHTGPDFWLHCSGVPLECVEAAPPTVTVTVTEPTEPPPPTTTEPPPPPSGCTATLSPSQSIGNALSNMPAGSVVCLDGAFSQNISYSRSLSSFLTLRCLPGTVLSSSGSSSTLRVGTSGSFLRVQGCVFRGSGPSSGGIIDVYGHHIEILGGEVTGSQDNGIYFAESSANAVVSGVHIHHNGASDANQDHAIYLQGDDHLIQGNRIDSHPFGFGVHGYDNGDGNRILDNVISNSRHAGIVVGGGSSGTYTNVEVKRNEVRSSGSSVDIENDRLDGTCTGDIAENRTEKPILTGSSDPAFPPGCAVNNTLLP